MRYIGIIILLVLCLTLLLFTGRIINTVTSEPAGGNLENQEDINQSSNNSQSSSTGLVYETGTEDTEEPGTVYPQQWATGDGTVGDPWVNDCIKKALDFVPAGGTIFLKAGYYTLSDQAEITKKVNIIGEGRDKTIITTADAHGFLIESVDYVTIKNLTIDGDAQTTDGETYRACISIGRSDYILLENIEVKNGGRIGIDANTINHISMLNIYAHDNYSHGIHAGTQVSGNNMYNTYRDIYAWNNAKDGFDDIGNGTYTEEDLYNVYDNLHCWDNEEAGISITTQHSGVLSNSSASGNGILGLNLRYIENFNIHDCSVTLNGMGGIYIVGSDNLSFTNVIVKNNNVSDGYLGGITIRNSNGTSFTSCQSYDDRVPPIQRYGISTEGNVDYVELVNCKLLPNKTSAIYNVAGAVINRSNVGQILPAFRRGRRFPAL